MIGGRRFDVVVVGAGPAGSAVAALLARRGVSVALLDKSEFPRDKVCGDFVNARALALLLELGVYEGLGEVASTPIRRASTYLDDECLGTHVLPTVEGCPPYSLTIPRRELDEDIFRCACAAGATDYQGTAFRALEVQPAGCVVVAERGGRTERFAARLVVGADGAESAVARATGLATRDRRYVVASQRAYAHGLDLDETVVAFRSADFPGFGWVFPVRPGLVNVGVGMLADTARHFGHSLHAQYQAVLGFLRRLAASRGARVEVEAPRGWPIKVYGADRAASFDRGVLVGEAACNVDPVSGEGIPLALMSAYAAADGIVEALSRGDLGAAGLAAAAAPPSVDLSINDLLVALTRNAHLRQVFLAGLRGTAAIARADRGYAEVAGGVFAGLTPSSALLSPRLGLAALEHAPAAALAALRLESGASAAAVFEALAAFQREQLLGVLSALADGTFTTAWLAELVSKQGRLAGKVVPGSRSDG